MNIKNVLHLHNFTLKHCFGISGGDISPRMFIDQDPPPFLGLQKEKDRKTKQNNYTDK